MSVTHDGTVIKSMAYDEQEVKTWTHDGVLVFSVKVQLKYVITYTVDTTGLMPFNLKKYSVKDNSLLEDYSGNAYKGYNDNIIKLTWGNLTRYRHTFTPLVSGTTTVNGAYNRGSDYGGSANQIVPYTAEGNDICIITFITTDEY